MRNGMGSSAFVFGALAFLALWMVYNGISGGSAYDKYPFILLNLVLSCLAELHEEHRAMRAQLVAVARLLDTPSAG